MKKILIFVLLFLYHMLPVESACLFDHFAIRPYGHWRGDISPEEVLYNYFSLMEIPAVIVVADYSYSDDPCAPTSQKSVKTLGDLKIIPSKEFDYFEKVFLEVTVEKAKAELFSSKPSAKKLYVKTKCGYKVIAVAKYMPRLYSVVATNEGFPIVFPGILRPLY
jgi:hypothetical protein